MFTLVLLLAGARAAFAQETWCGKVYMANETVVPPGGQFPVPAASTTPLLALRCQPSLIPFLPDDGHTAEVIVDALIRFSHIAGAQDVDLTGARAKDGLVVTAAIDGVHVASGRVALNGTTALPISLASLTPRVEPYTLTCTGTLGSQRFASQVANLTYLPDPPSHIGSVTKRDLRTGGIVAKKVGGNGGYEPVLPVGFYTNFGGYLEGNDTVVEVLAEQGFNMIHPVPTFDNLTAFNQLVNKMEELGLWLMYDMRWTYMNLTAVKDETVPLQPRKNLLLYYTGDEPDGTSDPLSATVLTYDLLRALDPYRPTSLVLNCQDYFWTDYSAGADIVMQDAYNVGNNLTFSTVWDTPCTTERGDCGCDNCQGGFEDIRERVTQFRERMEIVGWERTKTVWTVPQGFGGSSYWSRAPTGAEWLVEAIVGINAGALGVVSWNDPTPADIKASASTLARAAPVLAQHILSPSSTFAHVVTADRLDIGVWVSSNSKTALLLGANLNYGSASVSLADVLATAGLAPALGGVSTVFDGGAYIEGGAIAFGSVQSGAWVVPVEKAARASG
ncbi:hypothetical protein K488DRAFT_71145 [Vararia minispora EC-137]|uniref:Uncharacterized protein n=1 Tax=Vararia minispora EC-137 TaxID=1314806 RepID=A0ACB8QJI2_9AGAM|nr:hypothetical protein K488DRAFT_71145 [Vararia minispora EC-137]